MNKARLLVYVIILIIVLIGIIFSLKIHTLTQEKDVTEPIITTLSYDDELEIILNNIVLDYITLEYKPEMEEEYINKTIEQLKSYKNQLKNIWECYSEKYKEDINKFVSCEIKRVDEVINKYYKDIEIIQLWNKKAEEYPIATQIWLSMKEQGWSDYVCAGIMGNIMAECGGQTLDIKWMSYSKTGRYYGICQWSIYYYPQVKDASLERQLNYLYDTIEKEFESFGFCYRSKFTYEDFLHMNNCRDVALAFAKVYERCGSASYGVRKSNAEKAYDYFCN